MNFRPAGYSSDEEDDDFGDFSFGGDLKSVKEKQAEIVVEHYKKQLDLNNTPEHRLYNALTLGSVESVRQELDAGTDVNCKLTNDYSPLFLAVLHVKIDIVQELLKRGADPKTNREGYNALMAACDVPKNTTSSDKIVSMLKQLLEYRIDAKAIDRKRRTALMLASNQGFPDVVNLLIPFSRIEAEDNQGWTALFYAVNANNTEVVKILIDAGANINHSDVRLNDIKYYATINDYQEILNLLPKGDEEITPDDLLDKDASIENMFDNLQKNERPLFMNDVSLMLYGMQCDSLIPLFKEKRIGLEKFLCLNDEDLQNIGVLLTFQRERILKGLYKFHKHPFKQRSMPLVCADDDYSSYDILVTVANCVKHLTVMEASLKYLRNNLENEKNNLENEKQIAETCQNILNKFQSVKYVTKLLQGAALEFDSTVPNQPDLINKSVKFSKYSLKWQSLKWITIVGMSTLPVIYLSRIYRTL